jgi:hypothetical protein
MLATAPALAAGKPGAARPGVVETFTERAESVFDGDAARQKRQQVHDRLRSEMVPQGLAFPIAVHVTQEELDRAGVGSGLPLKVGMVKTVGTRIAFDDLTAPLPANVAQSRAHGALRTTEDRGYVYTTAVQSPGATAMRVHFTSFWLPPTAELYLHTAGGQVFGPYTGRGPHGDGDFWSHTVMGSEVVIQLRDRGPVTTDSLRDTWFLIKDVGFIGPRFDPAAATQEAFCSYNAPCVDNASCGTSSAVNDAKDAIAHMQWISGPYIYICTGGLLADTDGSSQIPYFLTANHCIRRGKDAKNMETFFQYTVSCGTSSCPDIFDTRNNHPQSLRTLGASILSTNSTSDYTLMELNQPAPAGSAFMGWTSAPVANSNGTNLYRISHPEGAPQAYSEHTVDTSKPTCQSWPRGAWIYSRDTNGATQGGSSGSPVVNGAGQVVGQLSGGCGYNLGDDCDADSNATVDGAFANYYGSVSQWLDPTPCVPSPEDCSDGSDNDCDGAVDCNDSDCTGDPACDTGGCAGKGQACSVDSDCCSNNCKRGTCKGN